jgi:hypothetical protein
MRSMTVRKEGKLEEGTAGVVCQKYLKDVSVSDEIGMDTSIRGEGKSSRAGLHWQSPRKKLLAAASTGTSTHEPSSAWEVEGRCVISIAKWPFHPVHNTNVESTP